MVALLSRVFVSSCMDLMVHIRALRPGMKRRTYPRFRCIGRYFFYRPALLTCWGRPPLAKNLEGQGPYSDRNEVYVPDGFGGYVRQENIPPPPSRKVRYTP